MERPSTSLVGSVAVHAGVIGLIVLAMWRWPMATPAEMIRSVPVSIVSETVVVEAAAADNPSEELVIEDAATAPQPAPPEPTPPESEPTPPTPRPAPPVERPRPTPVTKAPTPRSTPPRPTTPPRAQPTPPRAQPTPPRKANTPSRPAATNNNALDLDALAGPARPATRPGTRPATGQQGQGAAPRAIGQGDLQQLVAQIGDRWDVPCDLPGGRDAVIPTRVTLDERGRIVGRPRATHSNAAIADSVERAIVATAPFRMPAGYEQQEVRFSFRTARECQNR